MMWPTIIVMCTICVCLSNAGAIDSARSSEDHDAKSTSINNQCSTWECMIRASWIQRNMNSSVDPCDDFYEFTCGGFGKGPAGLDGDAKNMFEAANYKLDMRLEYIIGRIDKSTSAKPFKLVKILYENCMNNGGWSVGAMQTFINKVKDIFGWPVVVGRLWRRLPMSKTDLLSILLELNFRPDMADGVHLIPWIKQRHRVLDPEILRMGFTNEIVQAYYKYMVDIAVIFGADRGQAENELQDVVLTEIMLANDTLSEADRWIRHHANTRTTVGAFVNEHPKLHIRKFVYSAVPRTYKLTDNDVIIVPKDFKNVENILSQTTERVLANLAWWLRVEQSMASVSRGARDRKREFNSLMGISAEPEDKWQQCVEVVRSNLGLSLSALYQRSHIDQYVARDTHEMATFIQQAIHEIVGEAQWLDGVSTRDALQKVENIIGHVSYRDEHKDDKKLEEFYEDLELVEGDLEGSINSINAFWANYTDSYLRSPLQRDRWSTDGNLVSMFAAYDRDFNTYIVAAGLVLPDYYDVFRPKYLNYARLGSIIAHEMSHSLDNNGIFIDESSHLRNWLSSESKQKYDERVKCMIDQYGSYTVDEVGLKLRAYHNLDENIADKLGFHAAYRAYLKWTRQNDAENLLPGLPYTLKQLFWIGAGNAWCTNYKNLELTNVVIADAHSPVKFRINGALANIPEFSNDFGCKLGSKMNPVKKCYVW